MLYYSISRLRLMKWLTLLSPVSVRLKQYVQTFVALAAQKHFQMVAEDLDLSALLWLNIYVNTFDLHLEEIVVFLWDELEVIVSTQHITSLSSRESTEKVLLAGSIRL